MNRQKMSLFYDLALNIAVRTVAITAVLVSSGAAMADLRSEMFLRDDTFVNPAYTATGANSFGLVGAHFNNVDHDDETTLLQADVAGAFSENTVMNYLNVREFYLQSWGISAGRKLETWSRLDEMWNMGFYQPQFRWNPLLPESQGLTGFFFDVNNDDGPMPISLKLFGSFLYLPDQGPGYQLQGGQFASSNPWFQQLPTSLQIGNATNQFAYNIHMPETSQVVMRTSFAAQLSYGEDDKGWQGQAAFAYKPANQLLLATNTGTTSSGTTNVDIYPEVFYHTLTSADLRYSAKYLFGGFGVLNEKPNSTETLETTPANLTMRVYADRTLYSPYVGFKYRNFFGQVSYLDIESQGDAVVGTQSAYLGAYLPQRLNYGDAVKGELGYGDLTGTGTKRGLSVRTSYIQGTNEDFAMWVTSANWRVNQRWTLNSSVLFVEAGADGVLSSVFQQYQNNDAVSFGVTYVF